jgi:hypothetical protein
MTEEGSRNARTRSAELMALTAFSERVVLRNGDLRTLASAAGFLRGWQWDEERGCYTSHPYFGGTGRWARSVPDLMHTALMLRALRGAGVAANDPYCQRALTFISRCQFVNDSGGGSDGDRHERGGSRWDRSSTQRERGQRCASGLRMARRLASA